MKTTTIRLSSELDNKLNSYAKEKELSKNQVVKQALRNLLDKPVVNENN